MTVIVVDISVKARAKNESLQNTPELAARMLTLPEYLEVARRVIAHFAKGHTRSEMLHSEDAISFIAEQLMLATARFDETKGRTLRSYLNQCAIWAIQRWIVNKKSAAKSEVHSLDRAIKSNGEDTFHDIIGDGEQINPVDALDRDETIDIILNHDSLNDIHRQCLRLKYIENMSYREIGSAIGKSYGRAEQIVKEALSILREELEV